jgi:hypothetical protein
MYNFRFDADMPPGDVTLSLFKPGTPAAMVVPSPYLGPAGAGNVGATIGAPAPVLTVNGSTGGFARRVQVGVAQPISFAVAQPPAAATPSNFVICGLFGVASFADWAVLPSGIGTMLFVPWPLAPLDPALFVLADNFGLAGATPILASTPSPWSVTVPGGVGFPVDVTLQGVIEDATAPSTYSVTNGVILSVR